MKKTTLLLSSLFLLSVQTGYSLVVSAGTLGSTSVNGIAVGNIFGNEKRVAQPFVTGVESGIFTDLDATFTMDPNVGSPSNFKLEIRTALDEVPSSILATFSGAAPSGPAGDYSYTLSSVNLDAFTEYFLVLSADGNVATNIFLSLYTNTPVLVESGFTYNPLREYGGGIWGSGGVAHTISQISATTPVPEPKATALALGGLALFSCFCYRGRCKGAARR